MSMKLEECWLCSKDLERALGSVTKFQPVIHSFS